MTLVKKLLFKDYDINQEMLNEIGIVWTSLVDIFNHHKTRFS
ncbi:hypothetical protein SAMN05421503_1455 [Terribacillus aidingensis]|uniref:Uncharacterized protein n=1 Tax=Terribacillus aidingensis TaxID=586416 RepID=A0A285NKE5_9BACI|nr:hypothetical protein [Terribacillus aidingensis]SNZ09994.1 hypothetical protein SAMN05421503_1455 [Terribacillus aidingensis]